MEKKTKNFIVRGNLKEKVSFKFLPYELSQGSWYIKLVSFSYSINGQAIQTTAAITCNLVTSLTNTNNTVTNNEQPLALILFETKTKRKLVTFNEQWLYINIYSDELILSLISLEINENLNIDCDVFFIVQIYQKE